VKLWAVLMLLAGGLFAGGAASFSWARVPIWRTMPLPAFTDDFAATIRWADKVQPALLVVAIASAVAYAVTADGSASNLGWVGAAGFAVTLVASVAVLVPLQRRIIHARPGDPTSVEEMRSRWFSGHIGRSVVSTAAFTAVALAAVS
jgi:hypothetical protein